jgi:hypothetical protein
MKRETSLLKAQNKPENCFIQGSYLDRSLTGEFAKIHAVEVCALVLKGFVLEVTTFFKKIFKKLLDLPDLLEKMRLFRSRAQG